MHGPASAALPVDSGLGGCEQSLHLAKLGVDLLQLGCFAGEHVKAVVVANGHLVGQATKIPRQRGHALGQLQPAAAQLGH